METNETYFDEEVFQAQNMKKTIRRFLRSMGRQRIRLIIVLISVAAYTFFTILAPLYSANVVDLIWNQIKEARITGLTFRISWEHGGQQIAMLLLLYLAGGGRLTNN